MYPDNTYLIDVIVFQYPLDFANECFNISSVEALLMTKITSVAHYIF